MKLSQVGEAMRSPTRLIVEDAYVAGYLLQQSRKCLEKRRLARSVHTHEGKGLARPQRHLDVGDHGLMAVADRQIVSFDHKSPRCHAVTTTLARRTVTAC